MTDLADLEVKRILHAPADPAGWPEWRRQLAQWRADMRARLNYDDALYQRADFAWVSSNYACGFVLLYDAAFYRPETGEYAIDALIEEAAQQFGGYDSVVLWHAYPRIGFDDRNQFDFYRDLPGGLAGVRALSRQLQARGLKVFLNYNPWDTGTRREGRSDLAALVDLVQAVEADGIFLDTMLRAGDDFRTRLDAARPGVVLESERALAVPDIHSHHMSWAQRFEIGPTPGVLRNKWFERRHMQHQIRRWDRDHTEEIHSAWMNGSGLLVWENVFGSWVGWNARDRSLLRAMLPIQRRYTRLFAGEGWTPLVETETPDVYASQWHADGLRLWTLVNRSEAPVAGPLIRTAVDANERYYDLIAGRELKPGLTHGRAVLAGQIGPRGIGAILAGAPDTLGDDLAEFLSSRARLHERADFDTSFPARAAVLQPVDSTARYVPAAIPPGMVEIAPVTYTQRVEFTVRECGFYEAQTGLPLTFPGLHTATAFEQRVSLTRFAVDLTPVTNAQYAEFLAASGYRPLHRENFLRHWPGAAPPPGLEDHPVVYVDLDDARAYARWAHKRLPTEAEWQYAAQGPDGRRYPWGNEMRADACNAGQAGGTTPVTAFPRGRSPFGCYDFCGNTWEWTESERSDGRTRFCIVRGGSYYSAPGSEWYADGGPRPCDFAAKFLRLWPGLDRCATIGFRCVVDLADESDVNAG